MTGLLTSAETAARLGVSRQTLSRWEKEGVLARDAASARPRFRTADVAALADARAGAVDRGTAALQAAADLLVERGVDGCTLDAVAERAGMTRAGLAYHHPTKEHLVTALVHRFLADFESDWEARAAAAPPGPGRLYRAYSAQTLSPGDGTFTSAVLACALGAAEVRAVVRLALRRFYARLLDEDDRDGLDGHGVRTCLAADALWLFALLQVSPLDGQSQVRVLGDSLSAPDAHGTSPC